MTWRWSDLSPIDPYLGRVVAGGSSFLSRMEHESTARRLYLSRKVSSIGKEATKQPYITQFIQVVPTNRAASIPRTSPSSSKWCLQTGQRLYHVHHPVHPSGAYKQGSVYTTYITQFIQVVPTNRAASIPRTSPSSSKWCLQTGQRLYHVHHPVHPSGAYKQGSVYNTYTTQFIQVVPTNRAASIPRTSPSSSKWCLQTGQRLYHVHHPVHPSGAYKQGSVYTTYITQFIQVVPTNRAASIPRTSPSSSKWCLQTGQRLYHVHHPVHPSGAYKQGSVYTTYITQIIQVVPTNRAASIPRTSPSSSKWCLQTGQRLYHVHHPVHPSGAYKQGSVYTTYITQFIQVVPTNRAASIPRTSPSSSKWCLQTGQRLYHVHHPVHPSGAYKQGSVYTTYITQFIQVVPTNRAASIPRTSPSSSKWCLQTGQRLYHVHHPVHPSGAYKQGSVYTTYITQFIQVVPTNRAASIPRTSPSSSKWCLQTGQHLYHVHHPVHPSGAYKQGSVYTTYTTQIIQMVPTNTAASIQRTPPSSSKWCLQTGQRLYHVHHPVHPSGAYKQGSVYTTYTTQIIQMVPTNTAASIQRTPPSSSKWCLQTGQRLYHVHHPVHPSGAYKQGSVYTTYTTQIIQMVPTNTAASIQRTPPSSSKWCLQTGQRLYNVHHPVHPSGAYKQSSVYTTSTSAH